MSTAHQFLNSDLMPRIASFLPASDALAFSAVSKQVQRDLSLSLVKPPVAITSSPSRRWIGDYDNGDDPLLVATVPVLVGSEQTHSIIFQCNWKDQGWGNQKGRMFLVGHNINYPFDDDDDDIQDVFQAGRVVAASASCAPHEYGRLELTFSPTDHESYSLWRIVGAHGGHELFVRDASIVTLIYDDEQRSRTSAYRQAAAQFVPLAATDADYESDDDLLIIAQDLWDESDED